MYEDLRVFSKDFITIFKMKLIFIIISLTIMNLNYQKILKVAHDTAKN